MTRRDLAFTMVLMLMAGTMAAASLTTWLLLTSPMKAVNAFDTGDMTPLLQTAMRVLYDALSYLGQYL